MIKEIDLLNILHPKETALVGRDNGEATLDKLIDEGFDFNKLENEYEKIIIIVPNRIISINKSYFLGLFEIVIKRLGKDFLNKYEFKTTSHIQNKIKRHVGAALLVFDNKE